MVRPLFQKNMVQDTPENHSEHFVRCPDLGDAPIVINQWLVDSGSDVLAGDRIAELISSGVVVHLAAPVSGVLLIEAIRGEQPHPGQPLARIRGDSE